MSFDSKILKAIKNPSLALKKISLHLRGRLDSSTVSDKDAAAFFAVARGSNLVLLQTLLPFLKTSKVIFDVGANAGYFSKEILDAGYKGKIVLFEPIPNLMAIAVRTLAPYNVEKSFINSALGDKNISGEIFLPNDSNIGWNTLVQEKTKSKRVIKISIEDTKFYAKNYLPDFIKIDVEGYELFVLRPFLEVINSDYRPTFLVELGWGKSNPNWPKFIDLASLFIKKGYKFFKATDPQCELTIAELTNLDHTLDALIKPEI